MAAKLTMNSLDCRCDSMLHSRSRCQKVWWMIELVLVWNCELFAPFYCIIFSITIAKYKSQDISGVKMFVFWGLRIRYVTSWKYIQSITIDNIETWCVASQIFLMNILFKSTTSPQIIFRIHTFVQVKIDLNQKKGIAQLISKMEVCHCENWVQCNTITFMIWGSSLMSNPWVSWEEFIVEKVTSNPTKLFRDQQLSLPSNFNASNNL